MPSVVNSQQRIDSAEAERLLQRNASITSATGAGGVGRHSIAGSTRSSALGRQYSYNYIDTGYDARGDGEERESIHASDSGIQIHTEPSATSFSTFLNITCNIVGVGVLAIPTAIEGSSLGFGMILIALFQLFSSFASYTLSVGCEYTQYFSQAQLLCHCLTGYADPNWDEEIDGEIEEGGRIGSMDFDEHHRQQQNRVELEQQTEATSTAAGEGYGATSTTLNDANNNNNNNHYEDDTKSNSSHNNLTTPIKKLMKRNSTPGSSTPMMTSFTPEKHNHQEKSSSTAATATTMAPHNDKSTINNGSFDTATSMRTTTENNNNNNNSYNNNNKNVPMMGTTMPTQEDVAIAEDSAVRHARRVNLMLDGLLAFTYFCYLVAYARVVADSMTNVSRDIGLPKFCQETICWLIIGGVVFLILSMRRVFQELKITSIIGIVTIYFVIVCLFIRYFHPDDYQPKRGSADFGDVRWWVLDGKFLNAFSTLSGAFGYQVNHPSFYQELAVRTPAAMQKPVHVSMTLITATYIVTGYLGYSMFGPAITSKQISGNVVNGFGASDVLINVARVGLFIHFVCVFPLLAGAVRLCIHRVGLRLFGLHDRADDPDEVFKIPFSVIAIEVFFIVACAVVVAGVVPGIAVVIDIAGCLGGTFTLMILPGIVGVLIFPEIAKRLADNDESVTQVLSSTESNNFLGFFNFNFSFRALTILSGVMTVIGVAATVGGFIVILGSL